jgi:hypothetical protein
LQELLDNHVQKKGELFTHTQLAVEMKMECFSIFDIPLSQRFDSHTQKFIFGLKVGDFRREKSEDNLHKTLIFFTACQARFT